MPIHVSCDADAHHCALIGTSSSSAILTFINHLHAMLFTSMASLLLAATRHSMHATSCLRCLPRFQSVEPLTHWLHHAIHTTPPMLWTARRAKQPVIYTPAAAMAILTTLGSIDAGDGVLGPDLWARVQQHPDFEKFNRRYMRRVWLFDVCLVWDIRLLCLVVIICYHVHGHRGHHGHGRYMLLVMALIIVVHCSKRPQALVQVLNDLRKQGFVHVRRETMEDGQLRGCTCSRWCRQCTLKTYVAGFQVGNMPSGEQLAQIHQAQLDRQRTHRVRLAKQRVNNAMNRAW